jgi:hypothetical protein
MSFLARLGGVEGIVASNAKASSLSLSHIHHLSLSVSLTKIYLTLTSATAGHGNMWRESYTAVLGRNAKDIFASVGLNLIARNHAMGATGAGPEIAMCIKEVYGNDIDVLVWDAGMLDGKYYGAMVQYFMRAALLPNTPAMLALHTAGQKGRRNVVRDMNKAGMVAMEFDTGVENGMYSKIPNTAVVNRTAAEVAAMPRFIQKFKCNKQMEKGDPGCGKDKYNSTICGHRKFRVSWHPGW